MLTVVAAVLFSTIALLATALFTLLGQLSSFRSEVNGRSDGVTADLAALRADIVRIGQKLDDHLTSPHPVR